MVSVVVELGLNCCASPHLPSFHWPLLVAMSDHTPFMLCLEPFLEGFLCLPSMTGSCISESLLSLCCGDEMLKKEIHWLFHRAVQA